MRFQEVYEGWRERRLSQSEAAEILGVCERSFRRYSARHEDSEGDLNSLADKRLGQVSKRKAAMGEIDALIALYLPLYVFCGQQLLCAYLRPSRIDGAQHAAAILKLLVKRLRQVWPAVRIVFRGDSGFCRQRIINYCERANMHYIVGLARNARLQQITEWLELAMQMHLKRRASSSAK